MAALACRLIPYLEEISGGQPIWGIPGQDSQYVPLEELFACDPEVIVAMPCGFGIDRSFEEIATLTGQADWHQLQAVASESVYIVDGNHYFNRPGPRLVESAEILADILHPNDFDFGHQSTGRRKFY